MNRKELKIYLNAVEKEVVFKNKYLKQDYIKHLFLKVEDDDPTKIYKDIISVLKPKCNIGVNDEFSDFSLSTNVLNLTKKELYNSNYLLDIICDENGLFSNVLVYDLSLELDLPLCFLDDKTEFFYNEICAFGFIKIRRNKYDLFFLGKWSFNPVSINLYIASQIELLLEFDFNQYVMNPKEYIKKRSITL